LGFLPVLLSSVSVSASAQPAGTSAFTVNAVASATDEASFRLLITNDDSGPHKYLLKYGPVPAVQQAHFTLDGKIVTQVDINAGDGAEMMFAVKLSDGSPAGTTAIEVQAARDDGQVFILPVSVTVNQDYSLVITSRLDNLSAITGQELSFDISVSNNGNKNLDNIKLSLELPYKWMLQDANPGKLALKPGESGTCKVRVSIPPSQVSGNNIIKVFAVSDNTASPKVEIPVSVHSDPSSLFWVTGIIALAGAGTLLYFRRHGRR
jgi:uncharacterized membrane protein